MDERGDALLSRNEQRLDQKFEVQKTEMEILVQQSLEVRNMVTLEEMQGHILQMKGEVADSAAQSLKQHFAQNPQDILSNAVMEKNHKNDAKTM